MSATFDADSRSRNREAIDAREGHDKSLRCKAQTLPSDRLHGGGNASRAGGMRLKDGRVRLRKGQ